MTSVLLIYPFFKPTFDRSIFRFPPLGIGYIAASLLEAGHDVHLLDCSFLCKKEALGIALEKKVEVVGIYCMVTMVDDCMWFARNLRSRCRILVAGGPLPTCNPNPFLEHFDIVVRGEGEQTMKELLRAYEDGSNLSSIAGIVYRTEAHKLRKGEHAFQFTAPRPLMKNLDHTHFPARQLLPNERYIQHGRKKYGYSITTVMSTRGCPYRCEFCSNVIFGGSYRERSPENVVDEIEESLKLGYDRIAFADDLFTLNRNRVSRICEEIHRRNLRFSWECLARVDAMDYSTALEMRNAGCTRIYFGIESGNDHILKLMKKRITTEQARKAVEISHRAGIQVGAFFILYYPGETDETVLNTLRFTTSLPLDYLGLTMPYILPGTSLYERVKDRISHDFRPGDISMVNNAPIYDKEFSKTKMRFAILKGQVQFKMRKHHGKLPSLFLKLFEKPTDELIKLLR